MHAASGSVTGTRCTRCTPPSNFIRDHTPSAELPLWRSRASRPCNRPSPRRFRPVPSPPSDVAPRSGCTSWPGPRQRGPILRLPHRILPRARCRRRRGGRGCQHVGELGVQLGRARFQFGDFIDERGIVGGEFTCGLQVAPHRLQLAGVATIGASCANRRPTLRALAALPCSSGSDSRRSSSACSASSASFACTPCVMLLPSKRADSNPRHVIRTQTTPRPVRFTQQFGRRCNYCRPSVFSAPALRLP